MTHPFVQKIIDAAHKPPECSRITVERRGDESRVQLFDRGDYLLYTSGWIRLPNNSTLTIQIGES